MKSIVVLRPNMVSSRCTGLSSHPRPQSGVPLLQSMLPATLPPLRTFYASLLIVLSLSAIPTAHSTNAAGEQFLKENALKEGVTVLPSGLQYVAPFLLCLFVTSGAGTGSLKTEPALKCLYPTPVASCITLALSSTAQSLIQATGGERFAALLQFTQRSQSHCFSSQVSWSRSR